MSARGRLISLIALLLAGGGGTIAYKAVVWGVPLSPAQAVSPSPWGVPGGQGFYRYPVAGLPREQQNAFRALLMIPVGALVVVVMRNVVGLPTSGTFMPILMTLAFLQTHLVAGLVIFALVVCSGLLVRACLARLELLMVPRIAAVVVVVIGIMMGCSALGARWQIEIMRSVTLFPAIILAWTVERLSIVWDEEGPTEVARQVGGSLLVAVIAYVVMAGRTVQYWVFTFPEVLLVALAAILALGRYTGYRLSEWLRFSALGGGGD